MDASGDAVFSGGLQNVLDSIDEFFVLAVKGWRLAQGIVQVIGTNKHDIDAGHAEDFISGFDGLNVLGHNDDENLVIGSGIISAGIGGKIRGVELAANSAF